MPIENLKDLKSILIPLFCVVPNGSARKRYIRQLHPKMSDELLDDTTELWYLGRMVEFIKKEELSIELQF
jgi:hypothetical protein